MKSFKLPLTIILLYALSFAGRAELLDQGLNSIMEIIDKAIAELDQQAPKDGEEFDPALLPKFVDFVRSASGTTR